VATEGRCWRHLDLGGAVLWLRYDLRRVYCGTCGTVVEQVPWASDPRGRFTDEFDEMAAYLAQRMDKTAVQRLLRIAWRSVGRCVERVVARLGPAMTGEELSALGVDELSYRKGQHYVTLVTSHASRRVIWGKEGRNKATLVSFFRSLTDAERAAIEIVTVDLCAAYIEAVRQEVPHATLVFDRFHVQRLVSDALDETRREEWRRLRRDAEGEVIKKSRWALLKNPVDLDEAQRAKLAAIQRDNGRIYRGYLLKEQFRDILDRRQPNVVRALLLRWLGWASRCRLPAFVKAARTIRRHLDGILAYVRWRFTNGAAEGLNNKARLATRRAYGFHSAEAVLAMIELCCSGLNLEPPLKTVAA